MFWLTHTAPPTPSSLRLTQRLLPLCLACLSLLMAAQAMAQSEPRQLSLEEALREAASNNYTILIQDLQRKEASQSAQSARLPYVPVLRLNTAWRDREPIADGPRRKTLGYGGALAWFSPIGTALELSAAASDQTSGAFGLPSNTALTLSAVQPLLRDGWRAGAWTPVQTADIEAQRQRERLKEALNDLLVQVEAAYWELAFTQADLKIKELSLQLAQGQFEDTRENIRRGLLAESDIYVVEENVVFFRTQIILVNESLTLAQSRLARLLQLPTGTPLRASASLPHSPEALPSWDEAVTVALRDNPALTQNRLIAESARLVLAFEDNRALPSLDLEGSLALNGLAQSLPESWGQSFGAQRPEVRVGLRFEVPLSWDTRNARAEAARTTQQRQLLAIKDTEVQLRYQIRDLLTSLQAQQQRLGLTQQRVKLARDKLDAEVERYRSGISNLDVVSRFQQNLNNTLISEQRAYVDLRVASSRLRAAQGNLSEAYGLEVR